MGLFRVDIELLPANGGFPRTHRVLVDTGASYLSLPRRLVAALGYQAIDRQPVVLATGETAIWEVAEVRARLEGRERTVLAFLAPESAPSLLGAQTLETFGLGVDPLARRLVPVDAFLAESGTGTPWPSIRRAGAGSTGWSARSAPARR
jgi:clan AA aspartic protease